MINNQTTLSYLFLFSFFLSYVPAESQDNTDFPQKTLTAEYTDVRIAIDGILDESVWSELTKYGDFMMHAPVDGVEASQQTEIQIAYNETHIFIAATIYDSNEHVVKTLKRDNWGESDSFGVAFDPMNKNTHGFAFGVNSGGAMTEVLLLGNNADGSWDNRWRVKTAVHHDHWIVEMAIPFKTLRFKSSNDVWGINFLRLDPGNFETHVWSPVPRQLDELDLGYFGELRWNSAAPVASGRNIGLIPYTSLSTNTDHEQETIELDYSIGGDAKVAITSGLNLDLTFNPDFSQVEVDQQVTNLDRFSVFFPERRQFFLENADIFSAYGQFANQPFYSRRIGLNPDGTRIPILAGARLSGNINQRLRIGAFSMQTGTLEKPDGNNFSAFSFQQTIGVRSNVKGFFLNRQAYGDGEWVNGDYGRNAGGELNLATKDGIWGGQLGFVQSFKENIVSKDRHIYGRFDYSGQNFRTFLFVQNLGTNYYADMGFNARLINWDPVNQEIVRIGYTQIGNMVDYYIYPKSDIVNFHWSGLENFIVINEGGLLNDWYTRLRHFIFFKNSSQLRFRLNNQFVDLVFPFPITETPLPADAYNMTEFNIQYLSDQRKLFDYEVFTVYGQFFNGTKLTYRLNLNYRVQPWLRFGLGIDNNHIRLPEPYGDLDLYLANSRIEINFSNSLFWTTFIQYATQADNFNINSRLQWRYAPMSDIYLVYTDNYLVEDYFGPKNKSLVLKVNYWLGL